MNKPVVSTAVPLTMLKGHYVMWNKVEISFSQFRVPIAIHGKCFEGGIYVFFAVFEPIVKVFPLNHLLCAVYDMIALVWCITKVLQWIVFWCRAVKVFPLWTVSAYNTTYFYKRVLTVVSASCCTIKYYFHSFFSINNKTIRSVVAK